MNQYLALEEVTDWLLATDIYITPYLNPNQITSGTLAYAVAAGKPVLSTPYLHAQEILENGRGVLTPFNDPMAMGRNLDAMLSDKTRLAEMEISAWEFGRQSVWSEVAKRYGEVFADATGRSGNPAIAAHSPSAIAAALDAAMVDEDALLAERSAARETVLVSAARR
jgi:glycosyltransferase involved in cell wall biosynthesis